MTQKIELTPADTGIIAATLDDLVHLGDDDATDALFVSILDNGISKGSEGFALAYQIIHENKRSV